MRKVHFNRSDGLERSRERFVQALRDCARYINANYDVDGLCRAFPSRIDALVEGGGQRLKH